MISKKEDFRTEHKKLIQSMKNKNAKEILKQEKLMKKNFSKKGKKPHWIGDYKNYPISNAYYEKGILPPKIIDKDSDKVVDWEDCNPRNKYEQGFFSSIGKAVSKAYNSVKSAVSNTAKSVSSAVSKAVSSATSGNKSSSSSSGNSSNSSSNLGKSSGGSSGSSSSSSSGNSVPMSIANPTLIKTGTPTYDIGTKTYTDTSGNKMSMTMENALKKGANFINTGNSIKTTSSSSSSNSSSISRNSSIKTTQTKNIQTEEEKQNIRNNPSGVIDVYKAPTKEKIAKSKAFENQYKTKWYDKTFNLNGVNIPSVKELYDNGPGKLFTGIQELTVGNFVKGQENKDFVLTKDGKLIDPTKEMQVGNTKSAIEYVKKYGGEIIKSEDIKHDLVEINALNRYGKEYEDKGFYQPTGTLDKLNNLSNEELTKVSPYIASNIVTYRKEDELNKDSKTKINEINNKKQTELEKEEIDYQVSIKPLYQKEYESGKMTLDEANNAMIADATAHAEQNAKRKNEEAKNEYVNYITPKVEETQNYLKDYDKKVGRNRAKNEIGIQLINGALVGGALTMTGGIGLVIGGLQLGRTALDSGEIVKSFKNDPVKFGLEVIPQLAGGIIGARAGVKIKGAIEGNTGNLKLANKISQIPKELEMNGIVDYLKYMKTIPIDKLRKIVGPEGEMTLKVKGGDLTILRSGEGILKAVRQGKNWNEQIIMGTDGVVQGIIKRTFKNKLGQNVEYAIKYKILENGNRITEYFQKSKKFAQVKDNVKPELVITEEIPAKTIKGTKEYALIEDTGAKVTNLADDLDYVMGNDGKFYSKAELNNAKAVKEKIDVEEGISKIKNVGKSKYKIEGELKNTRGQYEFNLADPVQYTKALLMAKETGNSKALAILKKVEKQRAKFSDEKGINSDLVKIGNSKTIIKNDGSKITLQPISEIKTPTLEIINKNLKGTTFKVTQTKNPGIAIRVLNKLNKALVEDAIKGGKMYMMTDPITGVLSRLKIPELRVKTEALKINQSEMGGKIGRIMALPKELNLEQLKYLIGVGVVNVKNLLDVLKNEQNLVIRTSMSKLNIEQRMKQLQMAKQQMAMDNVLKTENTSENPNIDPNMKIPKMPIPKPSITATPIRFPKIEDIRHAGQKPKFNSEVFKQLRYSDPMEALTGKKRYSDLANILFTKRYGNFYS